MSGAEALAVLGIVSNILQVTDFCAKVTDRVVEFSGRAAQLPGSFSDLRVVLAVARLNLKKLQARIKSNRPDRETLTTLRSLVKLVERDAKVVQDYLEKLPPPGASSAKVWLKAVVSVFSESKIKKPAESIMQNVELLGQTVTASLPTAEEIANVVTERQTSTLDRKLTAVLDKMKNSSVSKTSVNNTTFNNQKSEHRSSTGNAISVKGQTQINNTYITVNMSYEEMGAQLDHQGNRLMVPGTQLPFYPLSHAMSTPNLPQIRSRSNSQSSRPTGSGFVVEEEEPDQGRNATIRPTTPRPTSVHSRPPPSPKVEDDVGQDDDLYSLSGQTVTPTVVSYDNRPVPASIPTPPETPHRMPATRHGLSEPMLHSSVFELDSGPVPFSQYAPHSTVSGTEPSEVGTASDAWSDTMVDPILSDAGGASSSVVTTSTAVEDVDAINSVNKLIRQGAAAVNQNPSEAKRAYMLALNTCKRVVTYSPAFAVRKYRALTLAAIGLGLCTQDRQRYMTKAREYNAQAMDCAVRAYDETLVRRVRLDEAELQAKEARMLEKAGNATADATMKQFTAFGAFQGIANELSVHGGGGGCQTVVDCNTCAQALMGCGKMAGILNRNQGTFRTSRGPIESPRAYYEQALAACKAVRTMGLRAQARAEDLALLRDTEAQVQRLLHGGGG